MTEKTSNIIIKKCIRKTKAIYLIILSIIIMTLISCNPMNNNDDPDGKFADVENKMRDLEDQIEQVESDIQDLKDKIENLN